MQYLQTTRCTVEYHNSLEYFVPCSKLLGIITVVDKIFVYTVYYILTVSLAKFLLRLWGFWVSCSEARLDWAMLENKLNLSNTVPSCVTWCRYAKQVDFFFLVSPLFQCNGKELDCRRSWTENWLNAQSLNISMLLKVLCLVKRCKFWGGIACVLLLLWLVMFVNMKLPVLLT